jgi:hypothetical protein
VSSKKKAPKESPPVPTEPTSAEPTGEAVPPAKGSHRKKEPTVKVPKEPVEPWEADLVLPRSELQAILRTLQHTSLEGVFGREGDELVSRSVDPSHVTMSVTRIRNLQGLESLPDGEQFVLDSTTVLEQLRPFGPTEPVHLIFGTAHPKRFLLKANGTEVQLSRIDPAGIMAPKVPTIKGKFQCYLAAGDLASACKDAGKIADHVQFKVVEDGGFEVVAEGETVKWHRRLGTVQRSDGELTSVMYPLDMLDSILTVILETSGGRATITLETGNEYPLKIGADMPYGEATFLLAPRVEED